MEKHLKMQHKQQQNIQKQKKDCTFTPYINETSNEIISQSDKYRQLDDFLDRVEMYKEKKETKIKQLEGHVTKDLTFKPQTYSKHDVASKYYERQLKKLQANESLQHMST